MEVHLGDGLSTGVMEGGVVSPTLTVNSRPLRRRVCRICGQHHANHEPHVYDYVDEVDEDVTCHICLQPLVTPVDTPCGHTFCKPCLTCFMKVQQICPIDRKHLYLHTFTNSSLVLKKLLEKLKVKCPNSDHCDLTLQRGDLEDHLKYRCPGNWVSCPHSTAGCDVRGPQNAVTSHAPQCSYQNKGANQDQIIRGVDRPPIIEGTVTYLEIPRTQTSLGVAIVGGSDTPLRCVVIQEVFPDGLIAQDGRLQAGDQIIEIDHVEMTTATHQKVCQTLRRTPPVLRLGIYRERVESCRGSSNSPPIVSRSTAVKDVLNGNPITPPPQPVDTSNQDLSVVSGSFHVESLQNFNYSSTQEMNDGGIISVCLLRDPERKLGIKLVGRPPESGIYIMELLEGSIAEQDGRLKVNDRILAINGADVRYVRLEYASRLIRQCEGYVSLVVNRQVKEYKHLFRKHHPGLTVSHWRTKSAPERLVEPFDQAYSQFNKSLGDLTDASENVDRRASCESLDNQIDNNNPRSRVMSNASIASKIKLLISSSMGSLYEFSPVEPNMGSIGSILSGLDKSCRSLTSPTRPSMIEEDGISPPPALPPRSRQPLGRTSSFDHLDNSLVSLGSLRETPVDNFPQHHQSNGSIQHVNSPNEIPEQTFGIRSRSRRSRDSSDLTDLAHGIRKSLKIDGNSQKTVTISKDASESLGMRIGGGVNSNEGDTPIYIANIHPQGPVGKSKKVKKGDILLSVNGQSLLGLTHTQAVALLKATAELAGVTLSLLEGPDTFSGQANFVPSWLFWQKLPRTLHLSKIVILQRPQGASLGFSIVGGSDPQRGPEPIHVLFVVATSPAAIDGKLRCGDRLLSVDGLSLEGVTHATAVNALKQAGNRVHLEVVSWLGTEL